MAAAAVNIGVSEDKLNKMAAVSNINKMAAVSRCRCSLNAAVSEDNLNKIAAVNRCRRKFRQTRKCLRIT